jgi:hypothetical protein
MHSLDGLHDMLELGAGITRLNCSPSASPLWMMCLILALAESA